MGFPLLVAARVVVVDQRVVEMEWLLAAAVVVAAAVAAYVRYQHELSIEVRVLRQGRLPLTGVMGVMAVTLFQSDQAAVEAEAAVGIFLFIILI